METTKQKIEALTFSIKKDVENASESIEDLIDENPDGPYTHNIISATLRALAKKHGYEVANRLVDEFELTELYDIPKVNG